MIIFDLDGTLADCEHRRHFVCRDHPKNEERILSSISLESTPHPSLEPLWKPDWRAFYEACDLDIPIPETIKIANSLFKNNDVYEIWSSRCVSVMGKTKYWLAQHDIQYTKLKMRPLGDSATDAELKERWLNELSGNSGKIEMVFDDSPNAIYMWQRRGIFVFNCLRYPMYRV